MRMRFPACVPVAVAVCASFQLALISGCADRDGLYKSNVYSGPHINQSQTTRNVQISAVNPAKLQLKNLLLDGVQITYTLDRVTATSVQVGRTCGFSIGASLLISTAANETRIQPNSTCGTRSGR